MKKSLIALAVLAASGAAMAQSSVTLYGVADVFLGSKDLNAVTSLNTAGTAFNAPVKTRQTVIDSSGLSSSRWGLRGIEDLGNGMKGVFVLESGFNIDTGASASTTSFFNRQAFVGLDSTSFGTVSLGRHYSAYETVRSGFLSAQGNGPAFDATNSPAIGAANFNPAFATYARTRVIPVVPAAATPALTLTAQTAANAALLAAVNAQAGRIGAWTGYQTRVDNSVRYATPNFSGFSAEVVYGFGENKTATADATKNVSGSLKYANGPIGVALGYADDEVSAGFKVRNTAIGGSYDFGVAKAFLSFNQAKITGLANQKEWAVGVRAPVGATTLVAQYAQSKGDDLGKNQSFGLEAQYSLSKRTTAYAAFNRTKVEIAQDAKNSVFGLGVRHTF
jgi:predicted porin